MFFLGIVVGVALVAIPYVQLARRHRGLCDSVDQSIRKLGGYKVELLP